MITDSGGGGCFPSSAMVKLNNGKSVTMSRLQLGDKVQTGISTKCSCSLILLLAW